MLEEDDEWPSYEPNPRPESTNPFLDLFIHSPLNENNQNDRVSSHSDSDVSMRTVTPVNSPVPPFSNVRTDYTCFQKMNIVNQSELPIMNPPPTINAEIYADNSLLFNGRRTYFKLLFWSCICIFFLSTFVEIIFQLKTVNGIRPFSQSAIKSANLTNKDIEELPDNKIIGQASAHRINNSNLSPTSIKAILFVGYQGIGKTFVTSIIADRRHSRTIILDHSLPLLNSNKNNDNVHNDMKADLNVQLTYWLNQSNTYDTFVIDEMHSVSDNYKYNLYHVTRNFTNRIDGADFLISKSNFFDFTKLIGESKK